MRQQLSLVALPLPTSLQRPPAVVLAPGAPTSHAHKTRPGPLLTCSADLLSPRATDGGALPRVSGTAAPTPVLPQAGSVACATVACATVQESSTEMRTRKLSASRLVQAGLLHNPQELLLVNLAVAVPVRLSKCRGEGGMVRGRARRWRDGGLSKSG